MPVFRTFYLATCWECAMSIPFDTDHDRDGWVAKHSTSPGHLAPVKITTWEERRRVD